MAKLIINLPDKPGFITVHVDYSVFAEGHGFRPCSTFHTNLDVLPNSEYSLVFHNNNDKQL